MSEDRRPGVEEPLADHPGQQIVALPAGRGWPSWVDGGLRARLPEGPFRAHGVEVGVDGGSPVVVDPGGELLVGVTGRATFVVLTSACAPAAVGDWEALSADLRHEREAAAVGEHVADLELEYADGTPAATWPLRRRFETHPATTWYGFLPYLARAHRHDIPTAGEGQVGTLDDARPGESGGALWLTALENPHPEAPLQAVRITGGGVPLAVAGLTLWQRPEPPLAARRSISPSSRYRTVRPAARCPSR